MLSFIFHKGNLTTEIVVGIPPERNTVERMILSGRVLFFQQATDIAGIGFAVVGCKETVNFVRRQVTFLHYDSGVAVFPLVIAFGGSEKTEFVVFKNHDGHKTVGQASEGQYTLVLPTDFDYRFGCFPACLETIALRQSSATEM